MTAFSAPLWGRVGDRYGSKVLVLRSLTAFVLTKGAMAFVTAPWQLFALRALLGVFAGYGSLTVSMAAESVPREQMARAIGTVQIAQRLGPAIGPVIGGLLAPVVGLRATFLIAAAFYLMSVFLVAMLYRRAAHAAGADRRTPVEEVLRQLYGTPGFAMVFLVILCLQLVDRSFGPILPLYVETLGIPRHRRSLWCPACCSRSPHSSRRWATTSPSRSCSAGRARADRHVGDGHGAGDCWSSCWSRRSGSLASRSRFRVWPSASA